MKQKYLLFIVIAVLYGCTSPKYITCKQSEMVRLDLDGSVTNYIPIADQHLRESKILDSSYLLITGKKLARLDKYLQSLEKNGVHSPDVYLSKTLLAITQKAYATAAQSIQQIPDSDYALLKSLLTIDLNYEIERANGTFRYNEFLKRYQALIDAYPDDNTLKKIVAVRLRYLRYNY